VSKLEDYRRDYYEFSGKASDVARTLALSGLAVIWIFKQDGENGPSLPGEFLEPALWLVIALACDLLQYIVASAVWGIFHRYHEKRSKADKELSAPWFLPWFQNSFFYAKLVAVSMAYYFLLQYLWRHLFPG
jgi:hypothetical protein